MIRVRFWGTRGSITSPGRATQRYGGNPPCVQVMGYQSNSPGAAVQAGNPHIVLDGGTGLLSLQGSLIAGPWGRGEGDLHFLLSHYHWDHIIGFPFFEPLRDVHTYVTVYSLRRSEESLETTLNKSLGTPLFPLPLKASKAKIEFREVDFFNTFADKICL